MPKNNLTKNEAFIKGICRYILALYITFFLTACTASTSLPNNLPQNTIITTKVLALYNNSKITVYGSRLTEPSGKLDQYISLAKYGKVKLDKPSAILGYKNIKQNQYLVLKGKLNISTTRKPVIKREIHILGNRKLTNSDRAVLKSFGINQPRIEALFTLTGVEIMESYPIN